MDIDETIDSDTLRVYAEEVKKRIEEEKGKNEEDKFLRSSLRGSSRLKAIENYRKLVRQGARAHLKVNEAFEYDEVIPSQSELLELISYLQTKIPSYPADSESDQWKWLLNVLSDPLLSKAFLMHDRVASAYEKCSEALPTKPRYQWPILPGAAFDILEATRDMLMATLKQPMLSDTCAINQMSHLHSLLSNPRMQQTDVQLFT